MTRFLKLHYYTMFYDWYDGNTMLFWIWYHGNSMFLALPAVKFMSYSLGQCCLCIWVISLSFFLLSLFCISLLIHFWHFSQSSRVWCCLVPRCKISEQMGSLPDSVSFIIQHNGVNAMKKKPASISIRLTQLAGDYCFTLINERWHFRHGRAEECRSPGLEKLSVFKAWDINIWECEWYHMLLAGV